MTTPLNRAATMGLLLASAIGAGGCMRSHLVFATGTKFALDIAQRQDQTVDVTLGYDRVELASVPTDKNSDATEDKDAYSVLGTFHVAYGNPWKDEPLRLNQFFATGHAALKAAQSERFRKFFGAKAGVVAAEKMSQENTEEGGKP